MIREQDIFHRFKFRGLAERFKPATRELASAILELANHPVGIREVIFADYFKNLRIYNIEAVEGQPYYQMLFVWVGSPTQVYLERLASKYVR